MRLDPSATETRTKRRYYDTDAVRDQFGADAHERTLDATNGMGPGQRAKDGSVWHTNRKTGERERMSDQQVYDTYIGSGPIVDEVVE